MIFIALSLISCAQVVLPESDKVEGHKVESAEVESVETESIETEKRDVTSTQTNKLAVKQNDKPLSDNDTAKTATQESAKKTITKNKTTKNKIAKKISIKNKAAKKKTENPVRQSLVNKESRELNNFEDDDKLADGKAINKNSNAKVSKKQSQVNKIKTIKNKKDIISKKDNPEKAKARRETKGNAVEEKVVRLIEKKQPEELASIENDTAINKIDLDSVDSKDEQLSLRSATTDKVASESQIKIEKETPANKTLKKTSVDKITNADEGQSLVLSDVIAEKNKPLDKVGGKELGQPRTVLFVDADEIVDNVVNKRHVGQVLSESDGEDGGGNKLNDNNTPEIKGDSFVVEEELNYKDDSEIMLNSNKNDVEGRAEELSPIDQVGNKIDQDNAIKPEINLINDNSIKLVKNNKEFNTEADDVALLKNVTSSKEVKALDLKESKESQEVKRSKGIKNSQGAQESRQEQKVKDLQEKSKSFVLIKEGNSLKKLPALKTEKELIEQSLASILSLNWQRVVPGQRQLDDQRFAYCLSVLSQLRQNNYHAFSTYTVNPQDYNQWRQRLGDISLVQLSDQPLTFYRLENRGRQEMNIVETTFKTDLRLSRLLLGSEQQKHFFSGVLAFDNANNQSQGGVGRFQSKNQIASVEWYLLEWQQHYYGLQLNNSGESYSDMELIPLLYSRQSQQRNCRWINAGNQ